MRYRTLIVFILFVTGVTSCSKPDPETSDTSNGPIADCLTLTAPKNREYRIAAERECLAQPSLDARMKSKACLVQQELGRCMTTKEAQANGYDAAQALAETAEARRH
ncbi:hypothetical protein GCM10027084_16950 [Pseudoxanthomonas sangjuensis]|uniref:hypothetical protein n=1 Tax=Pseudoxanthomonas sangjuensis TaxID=1503750 RepID=UPI00139139CD|nr:hypothetical protein [Pseudoxanthomonas sangjuensis]